MTFDAQSQDKHSEQALVPNHRASFPEALAKPLLDLLGSDDAFRARFVADPREALRELGYQTPAAELGVLGADPVMNLSFFQGGLASKERILASRQRLDGDADKGNMIFMPFAMCAGR